MKLRDDIFPRLQDVSILDFLEKSHISELKDVKILENTKIIEREKILNEWITVIWQAFKSIFKSKDEVIEYINSFKRVENAELFIQIGLYYYRAKVQCNPVIKIITMFSIAERLMAGGEKYMPFEDWLISKKSRHFIEKRLRNISRLTYKAFKKLIENLRKEHRRRFGSKQGTIKFFHRYLTDEEKIMLVTSFKFIHKYINAMWLSVIKRDYRDVFEQIKEEDVDTAISKIIEVIKKHFHIEDSEIVGESIFPVCYDWKVCPIYNGSCAINCEEDDILYCKLRRSSEFLDEALEEVIKVLYSLRSEFIHEAAITLIIPEKGESNFVIAPTIYRKRKPLFIEIAIEDLENIFEKAIKRYFDTFLRKDES